MSERMTPEQQTDWDHLIQMIQRADVLVESDGTATVRHSRLLAVDAELRALRAELAEVHKALTVTGDKLAEARDDLKVLSVKYRAAEDHRDDGWTEAARLRAELAEARHEIAIWKGWWSATPDCGDEPTGEVPAIGRPVSRLGAIAIARRIIDDAERERIEMAEDATGEVPDLPPREVSDA